MRELPSNVFLRRPEPRPYPLGPKLDYVVAGAAGAGAGVAIFAKQFEYERQHREQQLVVPKENQKVEYMALGGGVGVLAALVAVCALKYAVRDFRTKIRRY